MIPLSLSLALAKLNWHKQVCEGPKSGRLSRYLWV